MPARRRCRGASCASDAFYPFPDAVEVCLEAGVTAFVQPGGSMRDAEVVAAVDRGGRDDAHDRDPPLPPLTGLGAVVSAAATIGVP